MATGLQARVRRLEEASGGDGEGCERCRGTLVVVSNAITGKFHSARWNGEDISEEDADERQTERRCPRCGRKLEPENSSIIKVGGPRSKG